MLIESDKLLNRGMAVAIFPMSGLSARCQVPGRVSIPNMYCIVLYR
jgi:hypothetical protein